MDRQDVIRLNDHESSVLAHTNEKLVDFEIIGHVPLTENTKNSLLCCFTGFSSAHRAFVPSNHEFDRRHPLGEWFLRQLYC